MPWFDEVSQDGPFLVGDDGAERNRDNEVLTPAPVPQITFTVGAVGSPMMRLALIAKEGCNTWVGFDDDIAPSAAVAALRLAFGSSFGPLIGDDPGATVTGPQMYLYPIDEHETPPRSGHRLEAGLSREKR
jgi:hypothetical protein